MSDAGDENFGAIEILSLVISECYVYKVPPLRTASGHRAEDWNLATPLFTGCMKVYQADTKLRIAVYSYKDPKKIVTTDDNLNVFGECPVEVKPGDNIINFVDSVIDSSRYYVIRIKDPKSTRTTLLGIGFREREQAFDFKNILNEYVRYVNRMDVASQMAALVVDDEALNGSGSGNTTPGSASPASKNESAHLAQHINPLKEGEKIKISLGGKTPKHSTLHKDGDSSDTNKPKGGGFGLKPPPAPGSTVFVNFPSTSTPTTTPTTQQSPEGTDTSSVVSTDRLSFSVGTDSGVGKEEVSSTGDDDDWGDFK